MADLLQAATTPTFHRGATSSRPAPRRLEGGPARKWRHHSRCGHPPQNCVFPQRQPRLIKPGWPAVGRRCGNSGPAMRFCCGDEHTQSWCPGSWLAARTGAGLLRHAASRNRRARDLELQAKTSVQPNRLRAALFRSSNTLGLPQVPSRGDRSTALADAGRPAARGMPPNRPCADLPL